MRKREYERPFDAGLVGSEHEAIAGMVHMAWFTKRGTACDFISLADAEYLRDRLTAAIDEARGEPEDKPDLLAAAEMVSNAYSQLCGSQGWRDDFDCFSKIDGGGWVHPIMARSIDAIRDAIEQAKGA